MAGNAPAPSPDLFRGSNNPSAPRPIRLDSLPDAALLVNIKISPWSNFVITKKEMPGSSLGTRVELRDNPEGVVDRASARVSHLINQTIEVNETIKF
jgi:hypothetical protein